MAPLFDPDRHFLVVTKQAAQESGLRKRYGGDPVPQILKRICHHHSIPGRQRQTDPYVRPGGGDPQPAVLVDDGSIVWTITLTSRFDRIGTKRLAYVVKAKPYTAFDL